MIGLSWLTLKPLAALFASGAVLTFFYLIPIRTIPVKVRLSVVGVLLALTALTESVELFREYREKNQVALADERRAATENQQRAAALERKRKEKWKSRCRGQPKKDNPYSAE